MIAVRGKLFGLLNISLDATAGWNYIILDDPANGQFKIDKIVRSDGTEINSENIWRTDRTFPATGRPIYEDKLHFLDFDSTGNYTIIYDSNDNAPPQVREIIDVAPNPRDIPVDSLTVVFTEAIRANTFDYQDLSLTLDGGNNLITDGVTISQVDPITFQINNLTGITGNIGQYQLSVDATGIEDLAGNAGAASVNENWLFTGDRPAVESIEGFTSNLLTSPIDTFNVTFTEIINAASFDYTDISLTRNEGGNLLNDSIVISQINGTTYSVSNLAQFTDIEGDYELLVTANNIQDTDNNNGIGGKGFTWVLDNTAPTLTNIDDVTSPRNTAISSIEVSFTQAINPETFDYQDLILTLDGGTNLITPDVKVEKRNETTYTIKGLTFLQDTEGEYNLTVNGSGIEDSARNTTTDSLSTNWELDLTEPLFATNIQVSATPVNNSELNPASATLATLNQYGQYRVNSQNITISGSLPEENLRVYLADSTTGENLGQATVTGSSFTGDIKLSGAGSRTLELRIVDRAGNSNTGTVDIFADVTQPAILEFLNVPQTSTTEPVNTIDVRFSEQIDLTTFDKSDITFIRDGELLTLPDNVTIEYLSDTTYRISGLESLTNTPGTYSLQVDATSIQDNAGNNGIQAQSATFNIAAPATPGISITQTGGSTNVTEAGANDTYNIALDTQPTAPVTITLTLGDQITANTTTFTFDDTNWNQPQTVIVSAINDTTPEGNQNNTINHTISSDDTDYQNINLPDITVNIGDDDVEIYGTLWHDLDGDSIKSDSEPGLAGRTVYLDTNKNGQLDTGETSTISDGDGNYSFTDLRPGNYTVNQVLPDGWEQTYPSVNITTTAANIPLAIPTLKPRIPHPDSQIQLNFSASEYTVTENGNAITEIIVTRTGDTSSPVSATLTLSDGTAKGCGCVPSSTRTDFNYRSILITFAENEVSKVIPVENALFANPNAIRIRNDDKVEGEEYFTIELTNPSENVTIGNQNSAKVIIIDDEAPSDITDENTTSSPSPNTIISSSGNTNATNLINLDDFWADSRFSNIKGQEQGTVIIDTGIDVDHPFFGTDADEDGISDRIVYQYDFADNDADASDVNGHGSHVSSILASGDDTYKGIAPNADIIALKVFQDNGSGYFSDLEESLQWVINNAETYNITSVNLSLGDEQNWNTPTSRYGIGDELAALYGMGIIVVAASGNNFDRFGSVQGLAYPAIDPNVLAVGAVRSDTDQIADFSQRHETETDIFAPGIPLTGANETGGTKTLGGTSQAAPHISGIAVLAQQLAVETLGRKLTVSEFSQLLTTTGVIINDGDDENDSVNNTGLNFPRVDMLALAEAILTFNGEIPDSSTTDTNSNSSNDPLYLPSDSLPLAHTVNLEGGEIVTELNFGSQKLNQAPTLENAIANQTAIENNTFNFTIPENTFQDLDTGDILTYTATLEDGNPLPTWLNFDSTTGTFNGTPDDTTSRKYNITVTATDKKTANISDTFTLTILNTVNGTSDSETLPGTDTDDLINAGAGDDVVNAGAGDDIIDGGTGRDRLFGGEGNDTYILDNRRDVVVEAPGEGIDTVQTSASHNLIRNVENLVLTGTANSRGSGNDLDNNITGNSGNNLLKGLSGNDTLIGASGNDTLLGGAGDDLLEGGEGLDRFLFGSGSTFDSDAFGIDNITDFTKGTDLIALSKNSFTALESTVNTTLLNDDFVTISETAANEISVAGIANASIIYNQVTGNLLYNENNASSGLGNGGVFANIILDNQLNLDANDFFVQA